MYTCEPCSRRCLTGCAARSCSPITRASRSARWPRCSAAPKAPSRPTCSRRGPGCARRWGNPVTDPRDDLDAWLKAQVHPLPPPPGTFELIRKRARRRKLTRAVVTAAGAAAAIAIIAAVPTLLIPRLQLGPGPTQSGAAAGQTQDASPAQPSPSPSTPTPAAAPAPPPPPPPHFSATAVTL